MAVALRRGRQRRHSRRHVRACLQRYCSMRRMITVGCWEVAQGARGACILRLHLHAHGTKANIPAAPTDQSSAAGKHPRPPPHLAPTAPPPPTHKPLA